jgi:hypothetical protein
MKLSRNLRTVGLLGSGTRGRELVRTPGKRTVGGRYIYPAHRESLGWGGASTWKLFAHTQLDKYARDHHGSG